MVQAGALIDDSLLFEIAATAITRLEDNENLPVTPQQIAASALEAVAAILHLHVRHPDGRPSMDEFTTCRHPGWMLRHVRYVIAAAEAGFQSATLEFTIQPVKIDLSDALIDSLARVAFPGSFEGYVEIDAGGVAC